jgi:hypothetical protein
MQRQMKRQMQRQMQRQMASWRTGAVASRRLSVAGVSACHCLFARLLDCKKYGSSFRAATPADSVSVSPSRSVRVVSGAGKGSTSWS